MPENQPAPVTAEPTWPSTDACCFGPDYSGACVCGPAERILRVWAGKPAAVLMTPQQRAWCISEILAVEGYSQRDVDGVDDAMIAATVLNAWRDSARDKGLY